MQHVDHNFKQLLGGFNSKEKGTIVLFNFTLWYRPVTYTEGKSTSPESFTLPLSSSNTRWSSGCIKLCGLTSGMADLCIFHLNVSIQSQNTKIRDKHADGRRYMCLMYYLLWILVQNGRFKFHVLVDGSNNDTFLAFLQPQYGANCRTLFWRQIFTKPIKHIPREVASKFYPKLWLKAQCLNRCTNKMKN